MGEFDLHGRCPVCSSPEAADWANDAYNGSTIADSDKDVPLIWSSYYNQNVCRLCHVRGQDENIDIRRDHDDQVKEQERQRMGYKRTYTTN